MNFNDELDKLNKELEKIHADYKAKKIDFATYEKRDMALQSKIEDLVSAFTSSTLKKESVTTKLNIHEAYDLDIITESEKNDLLYLLEKVTKADKEKQEILDNQDDLKKNFTKISSDLKKMVLDSAGSYKLDIKESKFFKDHEDHKEQHYLLEYYLKEDKDIPNIKVAAILHSIGNKVEKEFKSSKKEFLNKGLYFDNKKKDNTTRFVELHYDFY